MIGSRAISPVEEGSYCANDTVKIHHQNMKARNVKGLILSGSLVIYINVMVS